MKVPDEASIEKPIQPKFTIPQQMPINRPSFTPQHVTPNFHSFYSMPNNSYPPTISLFPHPFLNPIFEMNSRMHLEEFKEKYKNEQEFRQDPYYITPHMDDYCSYLSQPYCYLDRKSTRLNSRHSGEPRRPSSA